MNNPLHILQTLDSHLTAAAEITIFGRAALALGYPDCPATFATTNDVDAILPLKWLDAPDENLDSGKPSKRRMPNSNRLAFTSPIFFASRKLFSRRIGFPNASSYRSNFGISLSFAPPHSTSF